MNRDELAHELWAAAHLAPGEGISDAVARMISLLAAQPAGEEGVEVVAWLLEGGRLYKPSVETAEERAERRIAERKDETVKSPLVRLTALSAVTAEVEGLRKDAERWRYVSLQGDDTHWLNLLRVDLEDFGGNINAAVDALIDGEAPATAAKEV